MTKSIIYDGMIYIYALSLLFYFSDFIGKNQRAKRMGTGLLILVWILQAVFFILRMVKLEYMPVVTMFEILFFFSWIMVTLSLLLFYFFRLDVLVFFINIVAFAILTLNFFNDSSISATSTGWKVEDELLFIHISLAIASYAAFSVSAIFSCMYLFLHRKLKVKQWSVMMKRFPSLDKIERYIFRLILIGMPLLILSVVLGLIWIVLIGNMRMLFDPNVFSSFLVLAAYAFYLVQRMSLYSSGNKLALWSLAAYAVIVINFTVSYYFSRFHQWIWM